MKKISIFFKHLVYILNLLSVVIALYVYFSSKPYFSDLWPGSKDKPVAIDSNYRRLVDSSTTVSVEHKRDDGTLFSNREMKNDGYIAIFIGILCGLIAMVTHCIFPMIPLTVSLFQSKSDARSIASNALIYSGSIFVLYSLIIIPFLLLGNVDIIAYERISSSLWINIIFLIITLVFAFSFLNIYDIGLPTRLANFSDSRSHMKSASGVFFMALTLVLVSFSCTAPLLSLLITNLLPYGVAFLSKSILAFAAIIAGVFFCLMLFPRIVTFFPKSGKWLSVVTKLICILMIIVSTRYIVNIWRIL